MNLIKTCGTLALGFAATILAPGAFADMFTGKTNAVCAVINVVACTDNGACLRGQAHTFDLPNFIFIDVKKNTVRTTDDSVDNASSPILKKEITDKMVILQGVENLDEYRFA